MERGYSYEVLVAEDFGVTEDFGAAEDFGDVEDFAIN
jgi:hypothetical protein